MRVTGIRYHPACGGPAPGGSRAGAPGGDSRAGTPGRGLQAGAPGGGRLPRGTRAVTGPGAGAPGLARAGRGQVPGRGGVVAPAPGIPGPRRPGGFARTRGTKAGPRPEAPGKAKVPAGRRPAVRRGAFASGADQRTRGVWRLSAEHAEAALNLVLVDDGGGVPVADAVLIGQPVRALFAAQEGRPGFQVAEPFAEFAARYERDAGDEAFVCVRRVRQRH